MNIGVIRLALVGIKTSVVMDKTLTVIVVVFSMHALILFSLAVDLLPLILMLK